LHLLATGAADELKAKKQAMNRCSRVIGFPKALLRRILQLGPGVGGPGFASSRHLEFFLAPKGLTQFVLVALLQFY